MVLVTLQESDGGWRLEAPDTSPYEFETPPSDQVKDPNNSLFEGSSPPPEN